MHKQTFLDWLKNYLFEEHSLPKEKTTEDLVLTEQFDSLDIMEIFVAIENEYDIQFCYSDVDDVKTIKDLIEKVESLKNV